MKSLALVANYEWRSVNSHILVFIRENIKSFEEGQGKINGSIKPEINVKHGRKSKDS